MFFSKSLTCYGVCFALAFVFCTHAQADQKDLFLEKYNFARDAEVGSVISDVKATIVQDDTDPRVRWSLSFHVKNMTRDVSPNNSSIYVDFVDKDGMTVPDGEIEVEDWRDRCYPGADGNKTYTGAFFTGDHHTFLKPIQGIKIRHLPWFGKVEAC